MEAGGVATKLRPKASTFNSVGDSWWKRDFLWLYFRNSVGVLGGSGAWCVSEVSRCACLWEEFLE